MKLIKVTPGSFKLWGSYVIQGDILSDVPEDRIEAYKDILEKHFKPYPLPEEKKEAIPTITKIPFKEDDPGTKLTFHESIIDETPEELEEADKETEFTDDEIAAQNEERFTTADDNPGVAEGNIGTDDSADEVIEYDFSGEEDGFDEKPEPDKEPEKEDPKHSTSTKKNQTPRSKKGKNRR
jgi:hypothetical protein